MEEDVVEQSQEARLANLRELPYVIFTLDGRMFGLSAGSVKEMLLLPPVTPTPNTPDYIRGVINLRGKILKLVDARVLFGLKSFEERVQEMMNMFEERKKDHEHWLAELEACVKEGRKFELAVDPHECKFGKWYDHYKTDNAMMAAELVKFDMPHKQIHATAKESLGMMREGRKDEALELIERRRNKELADMIKLFGNMGKVMSESQREIVMVVESGKEQMAVTVDAVLSVERIPKDTIEDTQLTLKDDEAGGNKVKVGRRAKNNETVVILDSEQFASGSLG